MIGAGSQGEKKYCWKPGDARQTYQRLN
jgi:hypothetical protein